MKRERVRERFCERCGKASAMRYRVQADGHQWQLVCPVCTEALRATHPDYRYGGTWKARKRH